MVIRTSRNARRRGKKSLVCSACGSGKNMNIKMSFRGCSKARLQKHIEEVHTNPRSKKEK